MTHPFAENLARVTRRQLFGSARQGIGLAALASLLGRDAQAGPSVRPDQAGQGVHPGTAGQGVRPDTAGQAGLPGLPHHAPKAKRMVMLWQGAARVARPGTVSAGRQPAVHGGLFRI